MKCNMYVVCYDAYGYQLIFFFIHEYEVGCDIPVVKIWLGFPVYITAIYSVYDSMTMDLLTIIHLCIYRYTISQIMVMLSCTWFAFSMICPYMSITCMAIIFTVICTKWYCPIFHCDYAHISCCISIKQRPKCLFTCGSELSVNRSVQSLLHMEVNNKVM